MKTKKWTAERMETFIYNFITIEHLHRYSFAMPLVKNKRVLDIACGEGYGTNLLAKSASRVYGVDIDAPTVELAKGKYRSEKILFSTGRADEIPLDDHTVDVVVSFETIEHHDRHHEMLREIKRVLAPGGLLILSSPEAAVSGYNPHHIKELSNGEFRELIGTYFTHSHYYYQRIALGSIVTPQETTAAGFSYHGGDYDDLFQHPHLKDHTYNLCVAADVPIGRSAGTSFFDGQDIMVRSIVAPYLNSRVRLFSEAVKKLFRFK